MSCSLTRYTEVVVLFPDDVMSVIKKASTSKELAVGDFIEDCVIRRSKAIVSKLDE